MNEVVDLKQSGKSLIDNKNSNGPRIELSGTPPVIFFVDGSCSFTMQKNKQTNKQTSKQKNTVSIIGRVSSCCCTYPAHQATLTKKTREKYTRAKFGGRPRDARD